MKKPVQNKEKTVYGHSNKAGLADWLWALIPAFIGLILYVFFGDREWFDWAGIALGTLMLIGVIIFVVIMLRRSKQQVKAPACESCAHDAPYVIRDPLFKAIMEQYERDGLSDFTNYVSLRGWKLGYVEAEEDSIELIFLRKERQIMVSLFDGYAEMIVELQSDHGKKLKLDYDGFSEPIGLWSEIVKLCRDAARDSVK